MTRSRRGDADQPPGPARDLVDLLRRLRQRRALSVTQIATRSGLSRGHVSEVLRGWKTPSPQAAAAITRALGANDGEAAKAHHWAEQTRELQNYQRTHRLPAGSAAPAADYGTPAPGAAAGSSRPTPAQLPADNADFTGRRHLVDRMCARLLSSRELGAADVPVCAVVGMGGIGKTTMAVHVAHLVRANYPDGQLYVDLHGSLSGPTPATDVLARFLRDLGVSGDSIPGDEQERATLYRSTLVGRRILILLDNAFGAAQARPLIPGESGCAVIVTGRAEMPGLPAVDRVELAPFERDEAANLLDRLIGRRWQTADRPTVESVLDICAGLPLALDIVARRLASRPNWSLGTLAERLADQPHRLDELLAGDLAVRVTFMVSYEAIGADTDPGRRLFRLLGLVDAETLGLPAVAALAGRSPDATRRAIEALVDAHLVESPAPFRYRLHDLLGVYAAERARAEEPTTEQDAALRRLLMFYLYTTRMTALTIYPHRRRPALEPLEPDIEVTEFTDYQAALTWFDTELDNLVAAVRLAHDRGWHDVAWKLPMAMWDLFMLRGRRRESIEALRIALTSARHLGDAGAVPWVLNNLGAVLAGTGHSDEAVTTLRSALPLAREVGDRRMEATILANLGDALRDVEQFGSAIEALEQALVIFQEIDVPTSLALTHTLLGSVEYRSGQFERALDRYRRGLAMSMAIGDDYGHAQALGAISEVMRDLNQLDQAEACAREAVALNRRTGHRGEEAYALLILSDTLARRGDVEQARCHWREAVAILEGTTTPYLVKLRDSIADRWQLIEIGAG